MSEGAVRVLLVGVLALVLGCSACGRGRLDETETASAALRATQLYPDEFARRAPNLTSDVLVKALGEALASAPEEGRGQPSVRGLGLDPSRPRFVSAEGPKADVEAVRRLCASIPQQALDPELFACGALEEALERSHRSGDAFREAVAGPTLSPQELEQVRATLAARAREDVTHPDGTFRDDVLLGVMFEGAGQPVLSRPTVELERLQALLERHARDLAAVEVAACRVLLSWAWQMRGRRAAEHWTKEQDRLTWINDLAAREERRTREPSPFRTEAPAGSPRSAEEAGAAVVASTFETLEREGAERAIVALYPRGDQYGALMGALVRYRGIVARGGFTRAPDLLRLKPGGAHPEVPKLRARLIEEGWLGEGEATSEVLDEGLRQALRRFQRANQLEESGRPDKGTWRALNISAERRVAQITLALERWRQARPRPEYYVQINIPDFHGEVWRDGERQRRFRVVVGDPSRRIRDGKVALINATPLLHAEIDRVIYNPYWNIPSRILRDEVLPEDVAALETEERQAWLDARGFELMAPGTEWEWVRQRPGPGNALGQVKIIFPNPHDVYLHDTASRKLFARPVRAFSHGCMRVHEPLELARLLLSNDGQYDGEEVRRILGDREEHTLFLKKRVPVFIDYVTVRVDADGQVAFLTDVYGYDEEPLAKLIQ